MRSACAAGGTKCYCLLPPSPLRTIPLPRVPGAACSIRRLCVWGFDSSSPHRLTKPSQSRRTLQTPRLPPVPFERYPSIIVLDSNKNPCYPVVCSRRSLANIPLPPAFLPPAHGVYSDPVGVSLRLTIWPPRPTVGSSF